MLLLHSNLVREKI